MSRYIKIRRVPYEEPHHLELWFEASNGTLTGGIQLYVNATDLFDIAKALMVFPRHASDVFLYEIGSERPEDRWGHYFRLRAFTTDGVGHCAIQVRLNNNEALPGRSIAEFCIFAEASEICVLGKKFLAFADLQDELLEWSPTPSGAAV